MLLHIYMSFDIEYTQLNKPRLSFYTFTPRRSVVNCLLTQQPALVSAEGLQTGHKDKHEM